MSDDGATVRLSGDARRLAHELIDKAPDGWVMAINQPPRTLRQSDTFWRLCGLCAKQLRMQEPLDKQEWHDVFLSGFFQARGKSPRLIIGIEGERISLTKHSRWMGKEEMSDLLDYVTAWCIGQGLHVED